MRRTDSNVWTSWACACAMLAGLAITGCSSGGDSGGTTGATTGQAMVSLTDAAGDFLSYTVDVQSLTLTKRDGAVVETLPLATRVNFANYVDMTEFFTAVTIPSGTYVSARMRLDFSHADLQVEDNNGNAVAVPVGNIRDGNGSPLTTLDIEVTFDNRRTLTVAPGIPAHLTLDFNLQASNTADLSGNPPVVTVKPFLVADVDPQNSKTMRLRGPLQSVDQSNQAYQVFLRPVHLKSGQFGSVTVNTDNSTLFEIDETSYQGAAGLATLAGKPVGTATVAIGSWHPAVHQFRASEVLAGSSVPGGTQDVVVGDVVARAGGSLTVRGASLLRSDGTFTFRDTLTVTLGTGTKVHQQGLMTQGVTTDAVSVGQRLAAFGTLDQSLSTLDATTGLVRLLVTPVAGTVNTTASGSLEMNIQRIAGRRISLFNFAGTGTSSGTDADPAHYQVATGSLDLTGLGSGTPVRVLGFVTPFHSAAPDFTAQTVVNLTTAPAALLVNWSPPTAAPFSTLSDGGLTLNLAGAGAAHYILRGPVATDLLGGTPPSIVPQNPTAGLFAIGSGGKVQVFTQFTGYWQALQQQLSQGQKASIVGAHGTFDDPTATISADQAYAVLQ
ncbi:MAG TPA: DUF4382 domain-containing protein [Nitrospira sp.]|nr:DUF4382 domain-containing protein [Nitrospira sp.]